ncbi:MAG: lantibiotic dehydratase [Anaerolineae bacterium]|nr:lantibiotic dehydratase [Anaerolineae bacterium]
MALADHLIQLPHGKWAIWRHIGLRGAGLPAVNIHQLAVSECAASSDSLLQAETAVAQTRDKAIGTINEALNQLRALGQWDDKKKRKLLLNAIGKLNKNQLPSVSQLDDAAVNGSIAQFAGALHQLSAARQAYIASFEDATYQISARLRQIAQNDRFQEALLWQNRQAFHTAVQPLLNSPLDDRTKDTRQREALLTSYLQRYCVKNDTIGSFGPVGWANVSTEGERLRAQPQPHFVEQREVYFDQWGMDILAETIAQDESLRPWFIPRRYPALHVAGTTFYKPFSPPIEIPAKFAAVLVACDGTRIAKTIAEDLCQQAELEFQSEAEVYGILEYLKNEEGMIAWTLELPVQWQPDHALRQRLEVVEPETLRQKALAPLDALENARQGVVKALGKPVELDHALKEVEKTFARLTSSFTVQTSEETKMGRTLVYEDCRRAIDAYIGPDLLHELSQPLSLLLESARWFTYEAAKAYRFHFNKIYEEFVYQSGQKSIPLLYFMPQLEIIFFDNIVKPLIDPIQAEFRRKWGDIFAIPAGQRQVSYMSDALRAEVEKQFAAPSPGWPEALYHTPDVMIAADSVEAINLGAYQFVLGEMHMSLNTLQNPFFVVLHPQPEKIVVANECDLPDPLVMNINPRKWQWVTARTADYLWRPKDYRLAFTDDACAPPNAQVIIIGELIVEEVDGELIVRTRDGRFHAEITRFFATALSIEVINSFSMLPAAAHTPRITIDKLIACRETWRMDAKEMGFAYEKLETERYLAVRRWAKAVGLPRFIFVKSPVEWKPFYLDFESPALAENFAKVVRKTAENQDEEEGTVLTLTEMVPQTDQVWLPDAAGNCYTSELRIVVVDQISA